MLLQNSHQGLNMQVVLHQSNLANPKEPITNAYDVLGLPNQAPMRDVKKRYRKLMLLLHPDKNRSLFAAGLFYLVQQAYNLINASEQQRVPLLLYEYFKNTDDVTFLLFQPINEIAPDKLIVLDQFAFNVDELEMRAENFPSQVYYHPYLYTWMSVKATHHLCAHPQWKRPSNIRPRFFENHENDFEFLNPNREQLLREFFDRPQFRRQLFPVQLDWIEQILSGIENVVALLIICSLINSQISFFLPNSQMLIQNTFNYVLNRICNFIMQENNCYANWDISLSQSVEVTVAICLCIAWSLSTYKRFFPANAEAPNDEPQDIPDNLAPAFQ